MGYVGKKPTGNDRIDRGRRRRRTSRRRGGVGNSQTKYVDLATDAGVVDVVKETGARRIGEHRAEETAGTTINRLFELGEKEDVLIFPDWTTQLAPKLIEVAEGPGRLAGVTKKVVRAEF